MPSSTPTMSGSGVSSRRAAAAGISGRNGGAAARASGLSSTVKSFPTRLAPLKHNQPGGASLSSEAGAARVGVEASKSPAGMRARKAKGVN